nr:LytR C-terminal domain-containing protein [Bifidobacterium catenulatum]
MAKQDKETYDSYEKDVYDNPPAGPMGVHRGARSAASRAMPYVIVIIVALLAGLLFWGVYSGEINNLKMPWSSQESPTTSSAEKSKSGESKSKSQSDSDSASGNKTDASNAGSSTDSQQNDQNTDQNAEQNADQNAEQTDNATAQQVVNTGTEVRVVNATNITGYAQSKADVLVQAGYTSVSASNPTGNVPSQTVVWYQNETDKATAENVAQTLGISNVQQSDGLVTPIVVVLLD